MKNSRIRNIAFRLSRIAEFLGAYAQGKGYGAASIKKENELVHLLLGRKPQVAIDIGGNVGDYTAELRRRNPNLEIHVFEPSKILVSQLLARFVDDKLISVCPFAVSDTSGGGATLFSNEAGSGLGSLTQRKLEHFNIDFSATETVDTICFEDYWRGSLGESVIDIVKLDIEGHELQALKGFGRALEFTRVIQFEFGGANIDTRTYFQDFWYFFKEHGFDMYRITPLGTQHITEYKEADEFFSTTNFIAVKNI